MNGLFQQSVNQGEKQRLLYCASVTAISIQLSSSAGTAPTRQEALMRQLAQEFPRELPVPLPFGHPSLRVRGLLPQSSQKASATLLLVCESAHLRSATALTGGRAPAIPRDSRVSGVFSCPARERRVGRGARSVSHAPRRTAQQTHILAPQLTPLGRPCMRGPVRRKLTGVVLHDRECRLSQLQKMAACSPSPFGSASPALHAWTSGTKSACREISIQSRCTPRCPENDQPDVN